LVWVAGVDGCKKGWFRASRETGSGELCFHLVERARDLIDIAPRPKVLAIDIPIGLTEAGSRECDLRARVCLGWPRRCSVFPAPIRAALHAASRKEASEIRRRRDGRGVSAQAWGIYKKIGEIDELLRSDTDARRRIREAHPEVCFWSWSGGRAMQASKKTRAGKEERSRLATDWLGSNVLELARGSWLKKHVADDDILDAIATLWTADRVERGTAKTLPAAPPLDSTGLRMEIVY